MIYVTSDQENDGTTRKLEEVVFKGEKLAIGAKFFDCYKISVADALQDRMLSEAGKDAPRIVLMTRGYEVTDVLEKSQLSAGKISGAMADLVRKEYEDNFDKMCGDYAKLLNELDRLEGQKAQIADKKARLKEKPNAGKEKKLEREEAELKEAYDKWDAREKDLLAFEAKGGSEPEPKPES
ncbi:MAG TPA: hypothetical protein VIE39_02350 [Thermoanaerobaculia bacterium]